jgi:hypothetical protein
MGPCLHRTHALGAPRLSRRSMATAGGAHVRDMPGNIGSCTPSVPHKEDEIHGSALDAPELVSWGHGTGQGRSVRVIRGGPLWSFVCGLDIQYSLR